MKLIIAVDVDINLLTFVDCCETLIGSCSRSQPGGELTNQRSYGLLSRVANRADGAPSAGD